MSADIEGPPSPLPSAVVAESLGFEYPYTPYLASDIYSRGTSSTSTFRGLDPSERAIILTLDPAPRLHQKRPWIRPGERPSAYAAIALPRSELASLELSSGVRSPRTAKDYNTFNNLLNDGIDILREWSRGLGGTGGSTYTYTLSENHFHEYGAGFPLCHLLLLFFRQRLLPYIRNILSLSLTCRSCVAFSLATLEWPRWTRTAYYGVFLVDLLHRRPTNMKWSIPGLPGSALHPPTGLAYPCHLFSCPTPSPGETCGAVMLLDPKPTKHHAFRSRDCLRFSQWTSPGVGRPFHIWFRKLTVRLANVPKATVSACTSSSVASRKPPVGACRTKRYPDPAMADG